MVAAVCVFGLIFYLAFLVDWQTFRDAFSKGGIVVLGLYCLIAVGFFAAKTCHVIASTGGAGHH